VGLVKGGVNGVALPVKGTVAKRWDLRRQARVYVKAVNKDFQ